MERERRATSRRHPTSTPGQAQKGKGVFDERRRDEQAAAEGTRIACINQQKRQPSVAIYGRFKMRGWLRVDPSRCCLDRITRSLLGLQIIRSCYVRIRLVG